jgi:pimeloyl-ACP methyl ester carboxylesterase
MFGLTTVSGRPYSIFATNAILAVVVVVLVLLGVVPTWPGLVQAVSLPPLGLTADLRIVVVDAPGYPQFLFGVVLSLIVRSIVLAAMIGWSRATVTFAVRIHVMAFPLAAVAAMGLFAAPATMFYLLFWIGAAVAVGSELLVTAMAFSGETTLRGAVAIAGRSWLRLGTVGAYLVTLLVLGAIGDMSGAPVALIPLSAALTAVTAWMLLDDPGWRWLVCVRRSLAGLGATGATALVLVVATGPPEPQAPDGLPDRRQGSVLLMSGVDSSSGSGAVLELDPRSLGFSCEQTFYFSYAGPGDGQPRNAARCPIRTGAPYEPTHTYRSTEALVDHVVAQVQDLPAPVTVLTHSQGAWVMWETLARHGALGVSDLVLIGPFPDNPVAYPADRSPVPGRVGTDIIDTVIGAMARRGGFSQFTYDSPLATELLADPAASDAVWERPLPAGVRTMAIPSVFDLPFQVRTRTLRSAVNSCPLPVSHPNLPYAVEFVEATNRHLDGRTQPGCPWWRTSVGPLFSGFSAPPSPVVRQGR